MKIMYQINSLETVYAARFIYEGYKDAFLEKGHEFFTYTANSNLEQMLKTIRPDIFITSLNDYNLKFLNLETLAKYRKKGLIMFTQIRPWKKQNNQFGGSDLQNSYHLVKLIKEGKAGDIFFHWLEQDDSSMVGFTENTGYKFETILLAANTKKYYYEYDKSFACDISFVGSYLPDKYKFIKSYVKPLMKKYNFKVYGSDWTLGNRMLGLIQKGAQYFNINALKGVREMQLSLEDEHKVYSSSTISLNDEVVVDPIVSAVSQCDYAYHPTAIGNDHCLST